MTRDRPGSARVPWGPRRRLPVACAASLRACRKPSASTVGSVVRTASCTGPFGTRLTLEVKKTVRCCSLSMRPNDRCWPLVTKSAADLLAGPQEVDYRCHKN